MMHEAVRQIWKMDTHDDEKRVECHQCNSDKTHAEFVNTVT